MAICCEIRLVMIKIVKAYLTTYGYWKSILA